MGWLRLRCRRDPQCAEIDAYSSEACRFSKLAMKNLKCWAPPLLYMVLIFVVSSLEQPPLPMPEFEWLTIDKLYHFIEYVILSGLVARALVKAKPPVVPARLVWHVAAVFSILYGASDEWHQTFVPGRFATVADWVADVLGSIAGMLSVYLYYRRQSKKRRTHL
jgi:VanZ family protein